LRYRQDTGDYPENLAELVTTSYLKEISIDSFSDKPLVYKKTDDNFLLYSFGENLRDDGGEIVQNNNGSIIVWLDEGDVVFWSIAK